MKTKPIQDSAFKTFDTLAFNTLKDEYFKSNKEIKTYREDSSLHKRFWKGDRGDYYIEEYYDAQNQIVKKIISNQRIFDIDIYGAFRIEQKINPYLDYIETYYSNGNIWKKFNSSWLGVEIGIFYEYDESGKLIKEIDFDRGYEFSFDDVLDFCKKKNIDLFSGRYPRSEIRRIDYDGQKLWVISYHNPEIHKITVYTLSGKSGEIIETSSYDPPRD